MYLTRTLVFSALLAAALHFPAIPAQAIGARDTTSVTIRNEEFQVVKVLNTKKTASAFRAIWSKKKKITSQAVTANWKYKIDFSDGERWLYDPAGYTQSLSRKSQHLYRIHSVKKFNALIGAEEK